MKYIFLCLLLVTCNNLYSKFTKPAEQKYQKNYRTSHGLQADKVFEDIVTISQQELTENNEAFRKKLKKAARDGIFCIEIPQKARPYAHHGMEFAYNFHKDEKLKDFKLPGLAEAGYIAPSGERFENFFCTHPFWDQVFTAPIQKLGNEMILLSTNILNKIYGSLFPNFNKSRLKKYIGDILNGTARYTYNFSYYGPASEGRLGAHNSLHKDVGYITIIYTNKKSLCAFIDNEPFYIPWKPDHFIVTLGTASEIFVNDQNKLTASWHWVEEIQDSPKVSIILKTHGNLHSPVYRRSENVYRRRSENGNFEIEYQTYQLYYEEHQDPYILELVTN